MRNFVVLLFTAALAASAQSYGNGCTPSPACGSARGASFTTASSMTWTGPTVTGTNTVGVVALALVSSGVYPTVTWGGSTMARITTASYTIGSSVAIYCIAAPASAATIVADIGANTWGYAFASSIFFSGASQSSPCSGGVTNGPSGSTGSTSFTGTGTAGGIVVDTIEGNQGTTQTATSPAVVTKNGSTGSVSWSSSYNATNTTMAWTGIVSGATTMWSAVTVNPFTAASATKRRILN